MRNIKKERRAQRSNRLKNIPKVEKKKCGRTFDQKRRMKSSDVENLLENKMKLKWSGCLTTV